MTFTVNSLSRCKVGGVHYTVNVSVQGGPTLNLRVTAEDMAVDFETLDEAREAAVARLRSAGKEANANTFAQWQTALTGNTFKL